MRSLVGWALLSAAFVSGCGGSGADGVPIDGGAPDVDDRVDAAMTCPPADWSRGPVPWGASWPLGPEGRFVQDVEVDAAGDVWLLGLAFGPVDLDPTAGELPIDGGAQGRTVLVGLRADGTFRFGLLFDPLVEGQHLALDEDGNAYVAGFFGGTGATGVDLDPTDGVAMVPVDDLQNAFVVRIDAAGTFGWAWRSTGSRISVDGLAARPDGTVLLSIEVTRDERPLLLILDAADGTLGQTREMTFSGPLFTTQSGGTAIRGGVWGRADLDPGWLADMVENYSVSTTGPNRIPVVSRFAPDLEYQWSNHPDVGVRLEEVVFDAAENLFVRGDLHQDAALLHGEWDLDPGPDVLRSGAYSHLSRWEADGSFVWALTREDHEPTTDALALTTEGQLVVGGAFEGTAGFGDNTASFRWVPARGGADAHLTARDPATGAFLWAETFGGDGDETVDFLRSGPGGRLVAVGRYTGSGDFDLGAGVALPPADVTRSTYLVAFDPRTEMDPACRSVPPPRMDAGPGTCTLTCAELGAECGVAPDGCGAMQACGTCPAPMVCGAAGEPNRCAQPRTVLLDGLNHPEGLALTPTDVVVSTWGDNLELPYMPPDAGVYVPPVTGGAVLAVPRDGGDVRTLWTAERHVRAVAVGAGAAFFIATGTTGELWRVDLADGTARELASGMAGGPVAVTPTHVIYGGVPGATTLYRVSVDGSGAPEPVAGTACPSVYAFAVDADRFYYLCAATRPEVTGVVAGCAHDGWGCRIHTRGAVESAALAVDGTYLYFRGVTGGVHRHSIFAGEATPTEPVSAAEALQVAVADGVLWMLVDDGDPSPLTDGIMVLMRQPLDAPGEAPTPVVGGLRRAYDVVADGGEVFWVESGEPYVRTLEGRVGRHP